MAIPPPAVADVIHCYGCEELARLDDYRKDDLGSGESVVLRTPEPGEYVASRYTDRLVPDDD